MSEQVRSDLCGDRFRDLPLGRSCCFIMLRIAALALIMDTIVHHWHTDLLTNYAVRSIFSAGV